MSGPELPPMSPALRALIDADNQRPGPSDGVRTGVYAALGVSLGVLPAGAIAAVQAATSTTAQAATAAAGAAPAGAVAASTVAGAAKVVGPLAFLAKAPLIGVGIGAVLGATLTAYVVSGRRSGTPRAERTPVTTLQAPASAAPLTTAPTATPLPAAEPALAPAPAALPRPPRSAPSRRVAAASDPQQVPARVEETPKAATSGALAAEQSLLDPARAALVRGDGATALSRLTLHERRFPAGLLSQEREAMAIHALVLTGARVEAERRAAGFRARYPGSLLGPTIDATLRSRP